MVSQITLLALASGALALMITSPTKNELWDLSKTNTIEWNAVNTDPQTFDIYLSHMASHPPTNTLLMADANKDTGSLVIKDLQLPIGETYQINFVAHNKPEQIYAQSQQFNTTGEAIAATSTLDGYTGPTYTSTAGGAAQTSTTESDDETSTRSGSSVTRTTLRTLTTTSSGTVLTQTTSAVTTEDAESTATNASQTNAGSATQSSSTPTSTPNAAAGNGASAPLAALVFGIAAFFL